MKKFMNYVLFLLEHFVHPTVTLLPEDLRYQRFLVPIFLLFCLLDASVYGFFAHFYLKSSDISFFSFGSAMIFVSLLALSRRSVSTRPVILSYITLVSVFSALCVLTFEPGVLFILLGRFSVYVVIAILLAGRRILQGLIGIFSFGLASLTVIQLSEHFVLPHGLTNALYFDAFLMSSVLSCVFLYAVMVIYNQTCDFSLVYMEKQKQWHDSNRLTKEFVNLAGDMNSVMQGPLEDVQFAIRSIRQQQGSASLNLNTIKRASDAVYGIARSFGVLAQNQKEAYMVRINLDELVRYAQIICQNNFQSLGITIEYEPHTDGPGLEFMGASGRWLLLLVSLMQFMAEQIHRTGGRKLTITRQVRDEGWDLVLLAEGTAPFEFPFDLSQKLKEESTVELLGQTSGKAFLHLLDRWGLKLGSFRSA
ncbi:MAG: hypothetical protein H7249_16595 [Chitinophagaceae bacterium]|nr:hypothetical protein [Oligoflexus sp.]